MSQKTRRRRLRQKHARNAQQAQAAQAAQIARQIARRRSIFPFLRLPGEILNMIYEKVFDRYSPPPPTISSSTGRHRLSFHQTIAANGIPPDIERLFDKIVFHVMGRGWGGRHSNNRISHELTSYVMSRICLKVEDIEDFLDEVETDSRFKNVVRLEISTENDFLTGKGGFCTRGGDIHDDHDGLDKLRWEQVAHRTGNAVIRLAKILRLQSLDLDLRGTYFPYDGVKYYETNWERIFLEVISGLQNLIPRIWIPAFCLKEARGCFCFFGPVPLHAALKYSAQAEYRASGDFLKSIYRCANGADLEPSYWGTIHTTCRRSECTWEEFVYLDTRDQWWQLSGLLIVRTIGQDH